MKKHLLFLAFLTLLFTACTKDDPDDSPAPSFDIENRIVFWSDFQGEPITVRVDGVTIGTITSINSSPPGCGSSGNVTRTYAPGTYSFTASESGSNPYTWSGSFTIESDVSCLNYLLHL